MIPKIIIDDGKSTYFWMDHWLGDPLINSVQQGSTVNTDLLVSNFIG